MSDIVVTEWGRVEDRIRKLEAQVAALTAERDRYRAALEQIYRMSDSPTIWAFIRETVKESEEK